MELTNDIIEEHGFKRINNSMWRMRDVTLQNWYLCSGDSLIARVLSTRKAYRVCYHGSYIGVITKESQLIRLKDF